jgi:hypothetical protein
MLPGQQAAALSCKFRFIYQGHAACCPQVGTTAYEKWATERPADLIRVKATWESHKRLYNPERQHEAAQVPLPMSLYKKMSPGDLERLR